MEPVTTEDKPCVCWRVPPFLHDGHCCFRDPDHDYAPDAPLPCGHAVPAGEVTQP